MGNIKRVIIITTGALVLLSGGAGATCYGLSKAQKEVAASTAAVLSEKNIFLANQAETIYERAKAKVEEEARRKAEEEARRKAEEEARKKAEEEARKKAEEEEAKRKAEEEAKKKAEEEERKKAEEAAKKAEEAKKAATQEYADERAPMFLYFRGTPSIKVGDPFDVHKYIGYGDDVDRHVDLTIEGGVDTSVEGTYPLKLTITDDAGKSTTKDMEVRVYTPSGGGGGGGGDTSEKEQFSDFYNTYKTENTLVGIDVSRYQGDIDFERVKNAGCEFVYMRIGGYSGGEHFTDKCFVQNFARAKAAGLKIGIYMYTEDANRDDVAASVKYIMGVLGDEHLDFPVAYDWEDYKHFEEYGMNLHDLNNLLVYFDEEVEKYGYTACLYGSKNAQNNIWTHPKKRPVWLAQYYTECTYQGDYFMWQQSSSGRIDGISGDVDFDVYYIGRLGQ